ncbi:hypothetical protein DLM45_15500 [Hyphomicrobium methylovorum]|nr:hypothetical protein [Hyphomicrobium methylovorum]
MLTEQVADVKKRRYDVRVGTSPRWNSKLKQGLSRVLPKYVLVFISNNTCLLAEESSNAFMTTGGQTCGG